MGKQKHPNIRVAYLVDKILQDRKPQREIKSTKGSSGWRDWKYPSIFWVASLRLEPLQNHKQETLSHSSVHQAIRAKEESATKILLIKEIMLWKRSNLNES